MKELNFEDLLIKNHEMEMLVQKEREKDRETLTMIAKEKSIRYDSMYRDLLAMGSFLSSIGMKGSQKISVIELDKRIQVIANEFVITDIVFDILGGVGLTQIRFNFSSTMKSGERTIILEDPKHYHGTSLSEDARLVDTVLFDWEKIRIFMERSVRKIGEEKIQNEYEHSKKSHNEIYEANREWINAMKAKENAA